MGNASRFLYHNCSQPIAQEYLRPDGVPAEVSTLAHDISQFGVDSQVPKGLRAHVVSSKKAQANWYNKLLEAWSTTKPPPKTPEDASRLVIATLKNHQKADVEVMNLQHPRRWLHWFCLMLVLVLGIFFQGLLAYYGLPMPNTLTGTPEVVKPQTRPHSRPQKAPEGVKFELKTLPVDAKAVTDGDTVTVYVSADDPREAMNVPKGILVAAKQREKARAVRNYVKADALQKNIVDAGYRVLSGPKNEDILARKYRIRLRGIDAPESSMPYGKEAKEELLRLVEGKCLLVYVYGEDRYNRCVGDIHCNGKFVQEAMLKKGCAWHYAAYDQRPELAMWEKEARAVRIGLWASKNPEQPWEYRKNKHDKK